MNGYEQEARRIIALVKKEFVRPDGALFLEKNGNDINAHHIFPDIGDVAPFFLYFGEPDFVRRQIDLYVQTLKNGLLVSDFPSLGISGLVKTYEYTDLMLGLQSVWEADPSAYYKRVLDNTTSAAIRVFNLRGNHRSFYHPGLHMRLPIVDTRDSTLIECFVSLYRATNDESYLGIARSIFRNLIATPFYTKHGLFADYEPTNALARWVLRNSPKTTRASLCKNNTNTLFAMLDLYRATKDPEVLAHLERLTDSVLSKTVTTQGGYIRRYTPGSATDEADLTASFAVLDYLCDLAMLLPSWKERAIAAARDNADYWLSVRGSTHLLPIYSGASHTFFDSQTDMGVALHKLAEVTGDSKYATAADELLEAVLRYHGQNDYPLEVDINDGHVVNATQRTKFVCLFLKLLILKIEQGKGKTIYTDPYLFELLKDR